MKKFTILIAALALVCFSVPAMAVDWNFYGNARMATFYYSEDLDDNGDEDSELLWDFQSNSRIGANIKAENISARFEFGVGEANVSSRRLYGVWNFGVGKLKVGKDYTPVSQFISGQVYDGDLGLLGVGTQYGSRHGQVSFQFGGFEIALINPEVEVLRGMGSTEEGTIIITDDTGESVTVEVEGATRDTGDPDQILPKIEAGWGMSFDTWNFNLMGGFQYYCISDVESIENPGSDDDVSVVSWTLGGDIGFNFGPGYIKGALSYGQNIGQANWGLPGNRDRTSGQGGFAIWDGDDDTDEVYTFMGAIVGGLKISDMFSFEAGFGYRRDNTDDSQGPVDDKDTAPWAVYLQSVIALAPGVYVIPEVGYYDYDNNTDGDDAGSQFYIGGKWQINF